MSFLSFPSQDGILEILAEVGSESPLAARLRERIARRLGSKTYDSSATSLILIEILNEFRDEEHRELAGLLMECVRALTADEGLAETAARAFEELHAPHGDVEADRW